MTRNDVVLLAALVALLLAACDGTETNPVPTTTTTPPSTSSPTPETTTTTLEAGPQPLPARVLLEPGEYVTVVFQPTVLYRIESPYILASFQAEKVTGFHNRWGAPGGGGSGAIRPHRGVAIHNIWLGLTPDETEAELRKLETIEFGPATPIENADYPGTSIEATVVATTRLWERRGLGSSGAFWLEPGSQMRFIILDTPAGSILITIQAPAEEWDDFLLVAEEILAGISFPDLE